ncbi:MAG: glutamine synthetase family protein [Candidatus Pedobacter colombiensis]|uniref:Glutamine synthetase family protein n=1 Tax=Candidatus Pedobacter colombiensis TaxID=3121371 RepID=A0AAJ5W7F8_9SPHI|nr:glutamine synthetase family protein [Pedobacter sp.]WEK19506.1 MAG: glutamine synthetase family protein [Pedobacter sp.]
MTKEEILVYIKQQSLSKVKIAVSDIDGVLRGKYISTEKFASVVEGCLGFCDVTFGWDMGDVAYDNVKFTGWHTGYPDALVKLDLSTFRKIPWENNTPFFLGDFVDEKHIPVYTCPRQLLRKLLADAEASGYQPYFAQEFEWFNFAETPETLHQKNFSGLAPLTPGMFGYSILRSTLKNEYMSDLFELLCQFDIPIEGLHTETGPGVYEAAIKYAPVLRAADQAVLFKTAVKEIAYKHGIMATFMAKISENLPGCSGHVHQSLWDINAKRNLFHDEKDPKGMSGLMKSYIAGQLHCLPHILPMIAPTINSYKRLVEGAWAPTTLTWGIDNRTVALRALPGTAKTCRLETRVVGSDSNPYLALSACLAAGLYGVKNNMKLDQEATNGNGYKDLSNGVLPQNLYEATQQMKQSAIAKELFGADFVVHFTQTREWECRQYAKVVTDWELKRYFEII